MVFFRCSPEDSTVRFRVVFHSRATCACRTSSLFEAKSQLASPHFRLVSVFGREIDAIYLLSPNDRRSVRHQLFGCEPLSIYQRVFG